MKRALSCLCCASGLLSAQLAVAQDEPEEGVIEGGSVETSAREVDGALDGRAKRVERISAKELERRNATNLGQALEQLTPGAGVSPVGGARGMIIDGLPASQVTVLADGLPLAPPTGSQQGPLVDLSAIAISPETIDRIDIYRGVGPVGSGSAGGIIIDIVSKRPTSRATVSAGAQARAIASGGWQQDGASVQEQSYDASGELRLSRRWYAQLGGQLTRSAAMDVNKDASSDAPARELKSGQVGLSWRPTNQSFLRLRLLGSDQQTESPGGEQGIFDDQIFQRTVRPRLQGRWWLTPDVRLDHHTDVGLHRHTFQKHVIASDFDRVKSLTRFEEATQSVALTRFTKSHDLAAELSLRGWRIARDGETGALEEQQGELGAGLTDTWYVLPTLEVYGRGFAQLSSAFGPGLSAQVGAAYSPNPGLLTWRASLSSTQRTPTPEELYLFFDHSEVGYQVQGNSELAPERLSSANLGFLLTSSDRTAGLEVMGFYHRIDDLIVNEPSAADPSIFTYENLESAHTGGARFNTQLNALPLRLALNAQYTFMPLARARQSGEALSLRSVHAAQAQVRRMWWGERVETWADVSTRSALVVPQGSVDAPGYALLGAGASCKLWSRSRLMLDVNNILNQTNATWGPNPGVSAMLSLRAGYSVE